MISYPEIHFTQTRCIGISQIGYLNRSWPVTQCTKLRIAGMPRQINQNMDAVTVNKGGCFFRCGRSDINEFLCIVLDQGSDIIVEFSG